MTGEKKIEMLKDFILVQKANISVMAFCKKWDMPYTGISQITYEVKIPKGSMLQDFILVQKGRMSVMAFCKKWDVHYVDISKIAYRLGPDNQIAPSTNFAVFHNDHKCLEIIWIPNCGLKVQIPDSWGSEITAEFIPPDQLLELEEFVHGINTLNREVKEQAAKHYSKVKKHRGKKNDNIPKKQKTQNK